MKTNRSSGVLLKKKLVHPHNPADSLGIDNGLTLRSEHPVQDGSHPAVFLDRPLIGDLTDKGEILLIMILLFLNYRHNTRSMSMTYSEDQKCPVELGATSFC